MAAQAPKEAKDINESKNLNSIEKSTSQNESKKLEPAGSDDLELTNFAFKSQGKLFHTHKIYLFNSGCEKLKEVSKNKAAFYDIPEYVCTDSTCIQYFVAFLSPYNSVKNDYLNSECINLLKLALHFKFSQLQKLIYDLLSVSPQAFSKSQILELGQIIPKENIIWFKIFSNFADRDHYDYKVDIELVLKHMVSFGNAELNKLIVKYISEHEEEFYISHETIMYLEEQKCFADDTELASFSEKCFIKEIQTNKLAKLLEGKFNRTKEKARKEVNKLLGMIKQFHHSDNRQRQTYVNNIEDGLKKLDDLLFPDS